MGTRLIQTCDECAPCAQGCCCAGMFEACMVNLADCEADCNEICRVDVGWSAPSDCLTALAAPHGGIKQYEVYVGECPDFSGSPVADRIFDGPEIEEARTCDYAGYMCRDPEDPLYEPPLIDRDGLLEFLPEGQTCGIVVAKGDVLICVVVRAEDDTIITQCVVCPEGGECKCSDPFCICDCGSSSSGGSGGDGSGGGSSGGQSGSGTPPVPPPSSGGSSS